METSSHSVDPYNPFGSDERQTAVSDALITVRKPDVLSTTISAQQILLQELPTLASVLQQPPSKKTALALEFLYRFITAGDKPHQNEISHQSLQVIIDNFDSINRVTDQATDIGEQDTFFDLLNATLRSPLASDEQKHFITDKIFANFPKIIRLLGSQNISRVARTNLINLVQTLYIQSPQSKIKIQDYIAQGTTTGENVQQQQDACALGFLMYFNQPSEISLEVIPPVRKLFATFGFDLDTMVHSYMRQQRQSSAPLKEQISKNLQAIINLESKRTGMCKVLQDNFGIEYFARYNASDLIQQYDDFIHRKDPGYKQHPFALGIFAKSDHNGGFDDIGTNVNSLASNTPHQRLYIIEPKSKHDLLKKIRFMARAFGKQPKMWTVLGGHGTTEGLTIDEGVFMNFSIEKDEINRFKKLLQKRLAELSHHISLTLVSCSTGAGNGLGQEISTLEPIDQVVGPPVPAGFRSFEVEDIPDGYVFQRVYSAEVPGEFAQVDMPGNRFVRGKLIP